MQPNVSIPIVSHISVLGGTGNAITAVIGMMTIEIAVQDVELYDNLMIIWTNIILSIYEKNCCCITTACILLNDRDTGCAYSPGKFLYFFFNSLI